MNLLIAILLSIIQGVTEWLPVSSSGHLAIIQNIFGIKDALPFDVWLHFASLLVIIIYFRKEILALIKNFDTKTIFYLFIATIPIVIAGILFYDFILALFKDIFLIGIAFILMGIFLILTKRIKEKRKINAKDALLIGIAQAFSLVPGISRSGSTIGTALFLKIKKQQAITFSFLLAIPALLGAAIYEARNITITPIAILSFLICFVVGYFSLHLLIKIIRKGKFYYFGYYCLALGIFVLVMLATHII